MNDDKPASPPAAIPAQDARHTRFRSLGRWVSLLEMVDAPAEDFEALRASGSDRMRAKLGRFLMHHAARGPLVLAVMREAIAGSVDSYTWEKTELIEEAQAKLAGKAGPIPAAVAVGYAVALTVLHPELTCRIRRGDTGKPWTRPLRSHWRAALKASPTRAGHLPLFPSEP